MNKAEELLKKYSELNNKGKIKATIWMSNNMFERNVYLIEMNNLDYIANILRELGSKASFIFKENKMYEYIINFLKRVEKFQKKYDWRTGGLTSGGRTQVPIEALGKFDWGAVDNDGFILSPFSKKYGVYLRQRNYIVKVLHLLMVVWQVLAFEKNKFVFVNQIIGLPIMSKETWQECNDLQEKLNSKELIEEFALRLKKVGNY